MACPTPRSPIVTYCRSWPQQGTRLSAHSCVGSRRLRFPQNAATSTRAPWSPTRSASTRPWGGDGDAVLIAHDWGAVAAWGAAAVAPGRWRRLVVMNIPPFQLFGDNLFSYSQIKRSFYFWFFQMQDVIEDLISADNFAFLVNISADR